MSFCFPVNVVRIFRVRYERGKNESVLHVVNESFPHSNIQPMEACVTPLLQKRVNTRNKGGNVVGNRGGNYFKRTELYTEQIS